MKLRSLTILAILTLCNSVGYGQSRIFNPLKKIFHRHKVEKKVDPLAQLVDSSDIIVIGTVTKLKPTDPYSRESDLHHLPAWQVATVEVDRVLKCDRKNCEEDLSASGNELLVRGGLPDSQGRVITSDPVLRLGQRSIFVLFGGSKNLSDSIFHLYFEDQVQPLRDLEIIKNLLKK